MSTFSPAQIDRRVRARFPVVGVVAIGLSVFRLTDKFTSVVPPQIAIAIFAGSIVSFVGKVSHLAATDPAISGPAVAGFVLTLAVTRSNLIAVVVAAASGFLAVVIADGMSAAGGPIALPRVSAPSIALDPYAIVALGIPILVLTAGIGNLQALAIARSEGYRVNANLFGLAAGIAGLVNALGGGHAAAIGGVSTTVAAGPGAGPAGGDTGPLSSRRRPPWRSRGRRVV